MSYIKNEITLIVAKVRRQLEERKTIGAHLDFKNPWILIATWFGSGAFLPASGTWGTIATLPFILPIWIFYGKMGMVIFLIVVFLLGMKASDVFEKKTNTHDSGLIVVDEVIGYTITLLATHFDAKSIFVAFLLFRAFDTLKHAFACDESGHIGWADPNVAPAVSGLRIAARDSASPAQSSSDVSEAFRRRQPIRAGRLDLCGAPAIAGQWQIDATPLFDEFGRFKGYQGRCRRPSAASSATAAHQPDSESDKLRQLLQ